MKKQALSIEVKPNDYILNDDFSSVWITVNSVSVHLKRTDEGVVVDLYKKGEEHEDSVASTYAFFNEPN